MLAHLTDVSIRSAALALIAGLVLCAMRRKHSAAMEHAMWSAVVCGMLGLFVFGAAMPRVPLWAPPGPSLASKPGPSAGLFEATPIVFTGARVAGAPTPAAPQPASTDWSEIAGASYAALALAFLGRFATGILLARRLIAGSVPVRAFYESDRLAVPVTIGWLRPKIVLPLEWREWDRAKLDRVLAHEGAHARRRDGLITALAAINRCIFWFHPLAWWLEQKLRLLAELACDEACVAEAGGAEEYARLLLEMASVMDGQQGRLRRHALTMAESSHIGRRIESILEEGRSFSRGLKWRSCAAIVLGGIPVVLGAGTLTLDREPALPFLPLEKPPLRAPAPPPPPPKLLAQAQSNPAAPPSAARMKFEVASIRPAAPSKAISPPAAAGAGALPPPPPPPPGSSSNCAGRYSVDAGRVDVSCVTLRAMLSVQAFRISPNRLIGPDWIDNQYFDFSAKLPEGATEDQLPAMFQALLEDRFGLVFHREYKEQGVYALVAAKGGTKLEPAKLELPDWAAAASKSAPAWGAHGIIYGVPFRLLASAPGPDGAPMTIRETPNMGIVRSSSSGGPGGESGVLKPRTPRLRGSPSWRRWQAQRTWSI